MGQGQCGGYRGAQQDWRGDLFHASTHSGSQVHCPLLWAGDQSVDFAFHDGIGSTVVAAFSAGLVGNPCHHSDIGGYTSLFGKVRSAELIMRWAELAAFTPVMRTHEGNRPDDNLQIDSIQDLLFHFARMTRLHAALAPYTHDLREEAATTGLPLQRPLFLHYWEDQRTRAMERQYLYGRDLLVVPVLEADAREWPCDLPAGDDWLHLWKGEVFTGGATAIVAAPFGCPPVFVRKACAREDFFQKAGRTLHHERSVPMSDIDLLPLPPETRLLGEGSPQVSAVAWGMWRFAGTSVAEATRLVESALDAGITLFDTADIYGVDGPDWGFSENLLGQVFAANPGLRDRPVLATKGGIGMGVPYDSSPAYLASAIVASLTRLQVDHVELWQVHRPDVLTHPEELARTLEDAVHSGKVGAVGVSNFTPA